MNEVYKRKLRYSESRRHFIHIGKEYRDMFPPTDETFIVVIEDKRIEVAVGSLDRIWAALFWDRLPRFREGDTIVFSKNADGSFDVYME